jgi:hypothetical protein
MWLQILISLAVGVAALYILQVALLWRAHRRDPGTAQLRDALRLLPDLLRLLRRLAADPTCPAAYGSGCCC